MAFTSWIHRVQSPSSTVFLFGYCVWLGLWKIQYLNYILMTCIEPRARAAAHHLIHTQYHKQLKHASASVFSHQSNKNGFNSSFLLPLLLRWLTARCWTVGCSAEFSAAQITGAGHQVLPAGKHQAEGPGAGGGKLLCASWKWQPAAADPEAAPVQCHRSPQGTAGTCPAFTATCCLHRSSPTVGLSSGRRNRSTNFSRRD